MDIYLYTKIATILFRVICGSACAGILLLIPLAIDVLLILLFDSDIFHTIGEIIIVLFFICIVGVAIPSIILIFIICLNSLFM